MIDLAKVVIWAEDKTKEAADSAQRNLQGVHNEVDSLKGKWAALGGMLGITAFAAMVKNAIDAQAKIKDLAIEAGMTVEQLTRFEEVGRTSGEGLEGIASAVGKLSRSMMEAKDPTSAQAQALRAINLSWAELKGLSPDEQLIKIAKAQAQYGGSLEMNAVLMALFSRGGAKFRVTLNEIAEAQTLASTTTQAQADAADFFKDSLEKLGLRGEKFARSIATEMLPHLNKLLEVLVDSPEGANAAGDAFGMLGEGLKYLGGFALSAWMALKDMGDGLGALAAKMVAALHFDWDGIKAIDAAREEQFKKNEEAYNKMWERLRGNLKEEIALRNELGGKGKPTPNFNPNAGKEFETEAKAYAAANFELDKQLTLLHEKERLGRDLTEGEKRLAEIEAGKYAKLSPLHQAELKAKAQILSAEERRVIAAKADIDQRLKDQVAVIESIKAIEAKIDAAKIEADTYGKTASQIALITAMRLEERRAQLLGVEGSELQVKALEIEIAKHRQLAQVLAKGDAHRAAVDLTRESTQAQIRMWDEVANRGADFFTDLVLNGRDAFGRLKEQMKGLLADMIALFAKRWILQMAGVVMGGSATTAGASLLGDAANLYNNGSMAGGLLGAAGGVYSGFTGASALAGAEAAGTLTTTSIVSTGGTALTAEGIGAGIYEGLAAIGPYGWIALAVLAVAAYFSGRGGGPKPGGSFMGSFDASGAFVSDQPVPGTDNGRFFTPNQGDPAMREFTTDFAEGFYRTLGGLGGTNAGMQFGFGFDRDPQGTADNRVSAMVRDSAGNVVYSSTVTAGRDDEDFDRAMALQMRRALLAGLQASELPEAIASIFDSLDVASATAEQIDGILALGAAMSGLLETLSPISVEEVLGAASETALAAWRRQGEQLQTLAENTDLSVESLGRLAEATRQYRGAAAQLIVQFEAARQAVAGGIGATIRDMRFSTLDQQGQYNMLRSEASTLAGGLGSMEDAQQIVDAVNQIRQLSTQAFGMLSDEERRAMLPQYEAGLREAQRVADERLATLRNQVRDEANAQLARQEGIANDMASASKGMEKAALIFDAAARRLSNASETSQSGGDQKSAAASTQRVLVTVYDGRIETSLVTDNG